MTHHVPPPLANPFLSIEFDLNFRSGGPATEEDGFAITRLVDVEIRSSLLPLKDDEYHDQRTFTLVDLEHQGPDQSTLGDLELRDGTHLRDHPTILDDLCTWVSEHPQIREAYNELCDSDMTHDEAATIRAEEEGGIVYRSLVFNPDNETEFYVNGWRWTTNHRTLIEDRPDLGELPLASWIMAGWDEKNLMTFGGTA